jgi:hypothetical protein
LSGFHPVEGVGEASLPKYSASPPPPKRKERKKKKGKGERERDGDRGGGREGGRYIYFGAAIQVISNPLVKLFLRALDKPQNTPQNT